MTKSLTLSFTLSLTLSFIKSLTAFMFRVMREVGQHLEIPLFVFGPETHMTAIVGMALETRAVPSTAVQAETTTANFLLPGSVMEGWMDG